MERVTFYESILKVLKTISSIPLFIEILILTGLLLIIMIFFYFRKSKIGRSTSLIIYIISLCLLPISHFSFFVDTLDKIVENYIKILYFPSCYVYIAILIITDVSILGSLIKNIKDNNRKWYVVLDIIYFGIFQFLFFMILRLVITNNIDIFERTELYSNSNLTSCLQISSYLFWIRFAIIIIIKIINKLSSFELINKSKDNIQIAKAPKNINNTIDVSKLVQNFNTDVPKETYTNNSLKNSANIDKSIISNENCTNNNVTGVPIQNDIKELDIQDTKDDYFYDDFFE